MEMAKSVFNFGSGHPQGFFEKKGEGALNGNANGVVVAPQPERIVCLPSRNMPLLPWTASPTTSF